MVKVSEKVYGDIQRAISLGIDLNNEDTLVMGVLINNLKSLEWFMSEREVDFKIGLKEGFSV